MNFTRKYASDWIIAYSHSWTIGKKGGLTPKQNWSYKYWMWKRFVDFIERVILEIPKFKDRLKIMDEFAKAVPDFNFSSDRVQRIATMLFKLSPRLLMIVWTIRINGKLKREN